MAFTPSSKPSPGVTSESSPGGPTVQACPVFHPSHPSELGLTSDLSLG